MDANIRGLWISGLSEIDRKGRCGLNQIESTSCLACELGVNWDDGSEEEKLGRRPGPSRRVQTSAILRRPLGSRSRLHFPGSITETSMNCFEGIISCLSTRL